MQPVDVLRPLALGQLPLRPREREVELAVERLLRRAPPTAGFAALESSALVATPVRTLRRAALRRPEPPEPSTV